MKGSCAPCYRRIHPSTILPTVDIVYRVDRGRAVIFDTLLVNIRRVPPMDSFADYRERLLLSLVHYHRGDTRAHRSERQGD